MDGAINSHKRDADPPGAGHGGAKAHLVGGGIASMAAAAFMIRDGDMLGRDITILEELDTLGGSLDGSGTPESGYVLRGGRMLEAKYLCTFGLFASIPTLDGSMSVTQEIERWNATMPTSSKSRLVRNGRRQTAPKFGLSERHILTIERLVLEPEGLLGRATIADQFDPAFFTTDFWFMWCTTFAFQPWHSAVEFKRYLARFAHMVPGFERLEGILRTPLNQYDSLVRPLHRWLLDRGVRFETGTRVTGLDFAEQQYGKTAVTGIAAVTAGSAHTIPVGPDDLTLVTLGSMTAASSLGGMDAAPVMGTEADGSAWILWEQIAAGRTGFGRPAAFAGHPGRSRWVSFTTTLHDPAFLHLVRDLTGNVLGEGGLVTFPDSAWLLSIVIPHQPHFIGQPEDVAVFWGYGLQVDRPGDFVAKPMHACTGREIMTELLGHLRIEAEAAGILRTCTCIPCMMPFITSQFMPRGRGDRPPVLPAKALMVIVPDGSDVEVEALNKDVGFIRVGQTVRVKLEAFPFTTPGLVDGTVASISRDAVEQPAKYRDPAPRRRQGGARPAGLLDTDHPGAEHDPGGRRRQANRPGPRGAGRDQNLGPVDHRIPALAHRQGDGRGRPGADRSHSFP